MQYLIQLERSDGALHTEILPHTDARQAYDDCVQRLTQDPNATVAHLHLGQTRIHTVHRR